MAFGFTPKFEQTYDLNGITPHHYLAIAVAAARDLGWDVGYVSNTGFIAYIGGGMFNTAHEFKMVIQGDSVSVVSKLLSSGMADWGKNKKYVNEFADQVEVVAGKYTNEQLDEKYNELTAGLPPDEEDELQRPPATAREDFMGFLSLFTPREGYYVTPIIINLNIAVFILMAFCGVSIITPTTEQLINWGANFRAVTLAGGGWRLFTCTFLHIGIFHLLLNMYALLYIGLLLEPYLGRLRFITAYLLTGVLASVASVYWHPLTVSAGASGAIFGMYGVFLAMLTTNAIDKSVRKALLTSIIVFIVLNLTNGIKAGVDNAAHVGGLVSGLVIGYLFYPSLKQPLALNIKHLTIGMATGITLIVSFFVLRSIPNDIAKYEAKMNEFVKKETSALSVFNANTNDKNQILAGLTSGLKDWNDNLQIINEVDHLDIPNELKTRDVKLKEYCQLRIQCYKLIYKQVDENSNQYAAEITSSSNKIQEIINDLKGGK